MTIKLKCFLFLVFVVCQSTGYAQLSTDGSYIWNVFNVNYRIDDQTDLFLNTKEHYTNQADRFDFYHAELTLYRKLGEKFSLGLGYRQTGNYHPEQWTGGHNYLLYGVHFFHPWNVKIKIANRFVYKTFAHSETQYGLDNISNIDFFAQSVNKIPKPYLCEEIFTEARTRKIQNIRVYGGLHVIKTKYIGFDLFYCYWLTQSAKWNKYNVFGLTSRVNI